MKRIICITLLFIVLTNCFAVASEGNEAITKELGDYKIMIGFENGELGLDRQLTLSEACKMLLVAGGYWDAVNSEALLDKYNGKFSDISKEHWAYPYILFAYDINLISSKEQTDGKLVICPDEAISDTEFVKMLVILSGYRELAMSRGGDVDSAYVACALRLGMLDGIDTISNKPLLRMDAADIIHNSLDIPLMKQVGFGADVTYAVMDGKNYPLVTFRTMLEAK